MSTYSKDAVGRLITTAVPTVSDTETIGGIEKILEQRASEFESINYIYIINSKRELCGVLSVKELFRMSPDAPVSFCTDRKLITVRVHTQAERAAHIAIEHSLKALPVISKTGEFLGVLTHNAIIGILNRAHTEDLLHLAGVSNNKHDHQDLLETSSTFSHIVARFPWLFIGLAGGIAAALVVERFETILAVHLMLAAFIPAIVYIADAVGSQTQMLFIRILTIKHNIAILPYLWRELVVNLILATLLGSIIATVTALWTAIPLLSVVLGLSIFFAIAASVLISILLPWLFYRSGYDPAVASGPLSTVICDIVSLLVYFFIASILLL